MYMLNLEYGGLICACGTRDSGTRTGMNEMFCSVLFSGSTSVANVFFTNICFTLVPAKLRHILSNEQIKPIFSSFPILYHTTAELQLLLYSPA